MSIHRTFSRDGLQQALQFWSVRVLTVLAVATALLYLIAVLPGVPYNIQELFGRGASLPQALLFALIVLFALGPPAYLGMQLIRLPTSYVWLFPVGILLHAAIVFAAFRYATPIESVRDLLGDAVWGIGDEWERMIRFIALFVMVSVPIAGGTAMLFAATRSYAPRRVLWWVLFQALFLVASYWIAVGYAATENVTVLLRNGGVPVAWLAIALWLLALAFTASLVAERLANVFTGNMATVFAVLLFLPLSYLLLFLATNQTVGGPRSDLSALEFLLSPSRSAYTSGGAEVFLRYSVSYIAAIILLAFSQYPAWLGYSTRRFAQPVAQVQPAD